MGNRIYYTTHGHDGVSRVWVKERFLAPDGIVFAECRQNKGGAELIRKLLQDVEDASRLKEEMARQEEEDERQRREGSSFTGPREALEAVVQVTMDGLRSEDEAQGACILYGDRGEDPDDCATHGHEEAYRVMRDRLVEWAAAEDEGEEAEDG